MKKTKINLLTSKDEYVRIEKTIQVLRTALAIYCSLFVVAALGFIFIQYQQNRNIQNLIFQKTALLSSLSGYEDQEAKLVFVAKKVKSYDKFILDDARFLPYYNLLSSALKNTSESVNSTSSATLATFAIDKERMVSFTLLFGSVGEMVDSFRYIESIEFLDNFEQLSLSGLTVDASQTENSLSFTGKFKKINQ